MNNCSSSNLNIPRRIVAALGTLQAEVDALAARLTAARTTTTHLLDATLHQILAA